MIKNFQTFLYQQCQLKSDQKIVLAVSGGIDSMVMLDLFSKLEYQLVIAHCNFKLRASESDEDCKFVKNLENSYNIKVYTRDFNTSEFEFAFIA